MTGPFSSIPVGKVGRTLFDESHEVSGTFGLSYCQPVFMTETIPGDSWNINVFNLTRLETLIAPAMQRVDASLLWFKAPKRLIFRHFKKWYSGGVDGQDDHEKPHIFLYEFANQLSSWCNTKGINDAGRQNLTEQLFGPGSLWNYLGLPVPLEYRSGTGVWGVLNVDDWSIPATEEGRKSDESFIDIMPIMFYHMVYDQFFRDQTLSQAAFEDADEGVFKVQQNYNSGIYINGTYYTFGDVSGVDLAEGGEVSFADFIRLMFMFKRAWKKDYYTSALPTPQRGPEVTIPLTEDTAPVTGKVPAQTVVMNPIDSPTELSYLQFGVDAETMTNGNARLDRVGSGAKGHLADADGHNVNQIIGKIQGNSADHSLSVIGEADLSGLSPITITAFRNLFKLQAFLEKNNVAGGRYIETILAHWAERVPDFTVNRAQHIRSTSLPVQISEVTATAYSSGVNSQIGDLAGKAKTQGNLGKVHVYTQEPSFVMALYCVGVPPKYAGQGISKMYQRITRFDEPWQEFQHIGEQAIKTRELYFDFSNNANNDLDFGYQQRFSEFKYMPDRVVGDFQTSLAYWHMARMFKSKPALNESFITQNPDERIFAVQNARPVTADFFFQAVAKRKLSKFSTPKLS